MDVDHCESPYKYILDIIEAIEDTTKDTIPYICAKEQKFKASQRKCIPGWKDNVLPYNLESNFW